MNLEHFVNNHSGNAYNKAVAELRVQLLTDALNLCNQNQTKAAEMLGISRTTLRQWVEIYDL